MASNPKSINSSRIVSEDISTDSSHSLEEDSKQLVNAQHTAIISLIVSNTVAIQKEIGPRNRKLRNVYQNLDQTVQALLEFKDVDLPKYNFDLNTTTEQSLVGKSVEFTVEADASAITIENCDNEELNGDKNLDQTQNESVKEHKNCCDKELEDSQSVNEHTESNRSCGYEIEKGDQDAGVVAKSDDGSTSIVKGDNSGIEIHKGTDIVDIHDESNCHPTSNMKECSNISEGITKGNQNAFPSNSDSTCNDCTSVEANNETEEINNSLEKSKDDDICKDNISQKSLVVKQDSSENVAMEVSGKEQVNFQKRNRKDSENPSFYVCSAENEQMHPNVTTAVSSYCSIMAHNYSTSKMMLMSLECIELLTTYNYICGRASNDIKEEITNKNTSGNNEGKVLDFTDILQHICKCAGSSVENVQIATAKVLLAIITSPKCAIHESSILKVTRTIFHIYLVTKHSDAKKVSKAALYDMMTITFSRMDSIHSPSNMKDKSLSHENKGNDGSKKERGTHGPKIIEHAQPLDTKPVKSVTSRTAIPTIFASHFHLDAYLIFRGLCKLSAKLLPADDSPIPTLSKFNQLITGTGPVDDSLAAKSKLLSLDLILHILQQGYHAFEIGEKFLYAIQHYLCASLLNNCMSNDTSVVHSSLKLFIFLVYKFKSKLKAEIEVFVSKIFLAVLDSPNSPYITKRLVLEALRSLCSDPYTLTQFFLNYDCDFNSQNLYKSIIHQLTTLTIKPRSPQQITTKKKIASQELALSLAGLEILVVILRAFLKALNLPGFDDNFDDSESGIRCNMQFDMNLISKSLHSHQKSKVTTGVTAMKGDENSNIISVDKVTNEEKVDSITNKNDLSFSTDDVAGKIVDVFDKKRIAQQNLEIGSVKFNLSFKQGILYFVENGFLSLDAQELALFLHEHKNILEKTQIGEVLGKEPESSLTKKKGVDPEKGGEGFYFRVLFHYVDAMNFAGLEFDNAIRSFLAGFRLPGEAQKIDRIMEKFAERFTHQNEKVFPSADTAFILAFSVIMLQTDLHSPSIKPEKRMTVSSFISNNRGISADGGDLPPSFLEGIFNRIKAQPFSLKEDDDARAKLKAAKSIAESSFFTDTSFFGGNSEDKKRERFRKEKSEMMEASEQLFKKRPGKLTLKEDMSPDSVQITDSVSPADVVKPMFDVIWGPLIGSLSQVLEMADDNDSVALCLKGFVYSIRLSSFIDMPLARNTFVSSLINFTTLGSIKEMTSKNIECIRTLLNIAIFDGNQLSESWAAVLHCISQLGRLQLFASGLASDDAFLGSNTTVQEESKNELATYFRQPTKGEVERETEGNNGRAVLEAINEDLIDKVFSSSVNLSSHGIVHFIDCLLAVSDAEIDIDYKNENGSVGHSSSIGSPSQKKGTSGGGAPRIFSLQRIVEVGVFNMNVRSRLAWAQIWEKLGDYFVKIGSHNNPMVSMFAIDALRQLSFKFLEKPELTDFNFQRRFLAPFLFIMEDPKSKLDLRELVIRCIDNMIRAKSHNLRSGWKICFSILALSARDHSERISTLGLAILQRLLDHHLDEICSPSCYEYNDIDLKAPEQCTTSMKKISTLQRKQRNSNAEDFVGLCSASTSFIQTDDTAKPVPIGLSMRALCHIACFADLIAEGKVLAPIASAQFNDPDSFGYSYNGMIETEAEEMVLWRPLLDGLGAGICSMIPSKNGSVGFVVQRGSLMTLRAILLRHSKCFSIAQWSIVLKQVLLPAIQIAGENDESPVTLIVSESPAVSSVDFISDNLPLPPDANDAGLLKFASDAQKNDSAPSRPLGKAELLVEASFADFRHGGDGNLSSAYALRQKSLDAKGKSIEQPFSESWIATTAPIAMGILTDLFGECFINRGEESKNVLLPLLLGSMQRWAIGFPLVKRMKDQLLESSSGNIRSDPWKPCEALVRIGCQEIFRIGQIIVKKSSLLIPEEKSFWIDAYCHQLAYMISTNVELENTLYKKLIEVKSESLSLNKIKNDGNDFESKKHQKNFISTQYGDGLLLKKKRYSYKKKNAPELLIDVLVVKLDYGAILYSPELDIKKELVKSKRLRSADYFKKYVPQLKVRCVASHCLQQSLLPILNDITSLTEEREIQSLLQALKMSHIMASKASLEQNLSHAFQEAIYIDGDYSLEENEASGTLNGGASNLGSSEMFFLIQQAGANNVTIQLLSLLFCQGRRRTWNSEKFAETLLLERALDVLEKFVQSESKEGHLISQNTWRTKGGNGGKIAMYCTSFAHVVETILNSFLKFTEDQFKKHISIIYPILCLLIKVESSDIRKLVSSVMREKVASILGISKDQ